MAYISNWFISKINRRLEQYGIAIKMNKIKLFPLPIFKNVKIENKSKENIVSFGTILFGFKNLINILGTRKKISLTIKNIWLNSKQISKNPILVPYIEVYLEYNLLTKSATSVIMFNGIRCYLQLIRDNNIPEIYVKIENISIDKYKELLSDNIISTYINKIKDNTLLSLSMYYQHDTKSQLPKFNVLFNNHQYLNISSEDFSFSKEYLHKELTERKHIASNYLRYDLIPKQIIGTIISTEDPTFGLHRGISKISLGLTLRHNIETKKLKVGGSTISQQLIKNCILNNERCIIRKIEEAIVALLMENYYKIDKKDILELYLNMIEFAPGVYGIEDASEYYFGKKCKELSTTEILVLTYIIPRPLHFHEALLNKTSQLKRNLKNHIYRFYPTLIAKKIIQENNVKYNIKGIDFVEPFGYLEFEQTNERYIDTIILHCSATKENEDVTVNDIRRWHIEKGYNDIGYHYVIYIDGSVHVGRDIKIEGAHCLGYNANSIGVCYVGGLDSFGNPKNTMNEKQVDSLIKLCKGFKNKYPIIKILGHNELSNRDCPCFDVKQFLKQNKL